MTPSGRNTGAETSIFNTGILPNGVAAMPPTGAPLINAGLGSAAVFHERGKRGDMVAPWDLPFTGKPDDELDFLMLCATIDDPIILTREGYDRTCGIDWSVEWALTAWDALWGDEPEPSPLTTDEDRWFKIIYLKQKRAANIVQASQDASDIHAQLEAAARKSPPADQRQTLNQKLLANLDKPVEGTNYHLGFGDCYLTRVGTTVSLNRRGVAAIVVGQTLMEGEPMRPVFRLNELTPFLTLDKTPDKIADKKRADSVAASRNEVVSRDKIASTVGALMFRITDYPADWKRPAWLDMTNLGSREHPIMVEGL